MDPILQERLLRGIAGYLAALAMTAALALDAAVAYAVYREIPSAYWWAAIVLFTVVSGFLHFTIGKAEMTARGN